MALQDTLNKMYGAVSAQEASMDAVPMPMMQGQDSSVSMPIMGGLETGAVINDCLLYTSPSPRDGLLSRMPSSA